MPRSVAIVVLLALLGQASPAAPSRTVSLALLGHLIGSEHDTLADAGDLHTLTAHFQYTDRGTPIALDATLTFDRRFEASALEAHGKSYRYFGVNTSFAPSSHVPGRFALDGMAPVGAQGILIQYWLAHGRPASIVLEPSGDRAAIRETTSSWDAPEPSRVFTVDGVIWGRERIWLAKDDLHLVAAVTSAGTFPFEAIEQGAESRLPSLIRAAIADRVAEAGHEVVRGSRNAFALIGGRVVDATGMPPIEDGVVVVRDGRIAAMGPRAAVKIPAGVRRIDATGQTILPGLWDTHAHVGQLEWGPVYLASGVTSARDMGGEFDVLLALREAWQAQRVPGPRLLMAGLVDGPGPGALGIVTAANPDEGRAAVANYHAAHFQQMKLYNLLQRPTVAAIIDAAHASGMTVTGHIPNGLTLREVVEMGFDNVAHLVVRDAPGSQALLDTVAFLKAHHTVMDPTISWNEFLGRSAQTPISAFQPGIAHVEPSLRRLLESANGGAVTPEQARARLERSLQIIKALHDGGVAIVAGTDKGVPGVSVAREIELYVEAGLTPIEAIRAATAVPAAALGVAGETGTLRPGLRADLIVVDGDPLTRISDIRNVALVCAGGVLYDAPSLWAAGGFRR